MKNFAVLFFVMLAAISMQAQPVKEHGQLHVQATQLADAKGNAIALHGMSFGWHNLWPRFYNAGAVHEVVSNWNCTVVRASMGVELNDKGYLKSPEESVRLMRNVIDACIKEGVYVIIDWHDHNLHLSEAKKFFTEMAQLYGQRENVIYELFNEPDYETWPQVKEYSEELIKAIRAVDADNIILVGSPHWDQDIHLPAADPIKGFENIMYTMHFYAGTHKKWLRDRTDDALKCGLPVFVSECAGMDASGDGPIDYAEWQLYVDWMNDHKLSWVAWSVSDKKETCSVLEPVAGSEGNWKESDIKPWGVEAKKTLLQFNAGGNHK
jgi:endoglucanase